MKVKVAQSCLTLCDPTDYTVHGILQARILEWVAVPFSRDQTQVSCIEGRFFYHLSHQGSPHNQKVVSINCPEMEPEHLNFQNVPYMVLMCSQG